MTRSVPYRVGVIGIGFGQQVHIPAFRMDPRFEVRAVCASTKERAQTVASRLGIARAYGDWRKLVFDPEIDVVAIATPPRLQVEILERVIDSRKHLFAEKPVGGGAARAADLARRAERAGLASIVDFEFETIDVWKRAAGLLRERRLGRLLHVVVSWNVETYAHRNNLTSSWKLRPDEGGGTLNSFGSHAFHYLEWLLGPIVELCARLHPEGTDEIVHLWLRTRERTPISVVVSTNSCNAHIHRLDVYGENGFVILENGLSDYVGGFALQIHTGSMAEPEILRSEVRSTGAADGRVVATAQLVKRLGDAIESGHPHRPDLRCGARVECLIDRARLSAREGSWVSTETEEA